MHAPSEEHLRIRELDLAHVCTASLGEGVERSTMKAAQGKYEEEEKHGRERQPCGSLRMSTQLFCKPSGM